MTRVKIADFGIIQKSLANAVVTFYELADDGSNSSVKATLYQAATGTDARANPQTLDEDGKLADDCYVEAGVMAAITGIGDLTARSIKKVRQNPLEYQLPTTASKFYQQASEDLYVDLAAVEAAAAAAAASAVTATTQASTATTQAGIATTQAGLAAVARAAADADVVLTNADVVLTHADVVLTHADVVLTHADVVLTGLDVVSTNADAISTAADRVQTGLDVIATAADRVQTALDVLATAADALSTAADATQTGLDAIATAADRVQTGIDATTATTQAGNASTSASNAAASEAAAALSAASLSGTSTTSITIGTGTKVFTTQTGKLFNGENVRVYSAANNANYMDGIATYSGTSCSVDVTVTGGAGTLTDWVIKVNGARGATGTTGAAGSLQIANAAGTADAITADFSPDVTPADNIVILVVNTAGANTVTNPTLNVDGTGAVTIKARGNVALVAGDTGAAGYTMTLRYEATGTYWELQNPAQLKLSTVGTPTYSTAQHLANFVASPGVTSGGAITVAAGANQVDVAAGTGFIKATDSGVAEVMFFDWAASAGVSVPSDTTRYIGIEYNAGSPQVVAKTTDVWDLDTEFPLGVVVNEAGTRYISCIPWNAGDNMTNVIERFDAMTPVLRDNRTGGLIISSTGTNKFALTAGHILARMSEFTIVALDTNVSGSFDAYYRDGVGGWTKQSAQTSWNATSYDDGTGVLATMTNNGHASRWFYLMVDGSVAMIYGQTQSTNVATILNSDAPPSSVPNRILKEGLLLGRFVFEKSATSPEVTQSAFGTSFTAAGVTNFSELAGTAAITQGGTGSTTASGALTALGITAAAQTVLDDATVSAMVDTLGGAASTGTGGIARATSPTFVTPLLGTPTSGTLTNCTGLPEAGLTLADNTTNNASTTKHGLMPKLSNSATLYFDSLGTQTNPALNAVLTGYTSGAGTVAATDTVLQAIQKLNGNVGALASGVTVLFSGTLSTGAPSTVDFTIPTGYTDIAVFFDNASCATATRAFEIQFTFGLSAFGSGDTYADWIQTAQITSGTPALTGPIGSAATIWTPVTQAAAEVTSGYAIFPNYLSTTAKTYHAQARAAAAIDNGWTGQQGTCTVADGTFRYYNGSIFVPETRALTAIRFLWNGSGAFDGTGTYVVIGIK